MYSLKHNRHCLAFPVCLQYGYLLGLSYSERLSLGGGAPVGTRRREAQEVRRTGRRRVGSEEPSV